MTGFAIHRSIPLTQGKVAWVDQADYAMLSHFNWHLHVQGYAVRNTWTAGRGGVSLMHRMIMLPSPAEVVDHVSGDHLDNRRHNLRVCVQAQNNCNLRRPTTNTSGFKGVSWFARDSRWVAHIRINGRSTNLGYFDRAEDAAKAYDEAAVQHRGEFARVNFPSGVAAPGSGRQAVA